MSNTTPIVSDKRCLRTREALEGTLFRFFIEHQYSSEKLSVVSLCESAAVSTPTFYRHYGGILEVLESGHQRAGRELKIAFENGGSLLIGLTKLFCFVRNNELYYRYSVARMNDRAFEDVAEIIRPMIWEFAEERNKGKRVAGKELPRRSKMPEVGEELCFEIENYVTTKLKWWITRDELDEGKIDARVREILGFMRRRVEEARRG